MNISKNTIPAEITFTTLAIMAKQDELEIKVKNTKQVNNINELIKSITSN